MRIFLFLGPLLWGIIAFTPLFPELSFSARLVLGTTLWMAVWWVSEVIPHYVTALLPLMIFPAFNILGPRELAASYGDDIIFLFFGGFLLSAALEKSGLHERLAEKITMSFGKSPTHLLLGYMTATAFLSMWISNTAAVLLMLPLLHSFKDLVTRKFFLLGVGYAASVGGLGTIIGSPPNAIALSFIESKMDRDISFMQWMLFGVPFAALGVGLVWIYLLSLAKGQLKLPSNLNLPRVASAWSAHETRVAVLFSAIFLSWCARSVWGWKHPNDTGILLLGIFLAFLIPAKSTKSATLLEAPDIQKVSWPILLLFGGGLALSQAFDKSGLSLWLSSHFAALADAPLIWVIGAVAIFSILLTEFMSNTALASILIPLLGAFSASADLNLTIVLTVCASASLSFMMPMATPPNALVFSESKMRMIEMAKVGFGLNLLFAAYISLSLLVFYYGLS